MFCLELLDHTVSKQLNTPLSFCGTSIHLFVMVLIRNLHISIYDKHILPRRSAFCPAGFIASMLLFGKRGKEARPGLNHLVPRTSSPLRCHITFSKPMRLPSRYFARGPIGAEAGCSSDRGGRKFQPEPTDRSLRIQRTRSWLPLKATPRKRRLKRLQTIESRPWALAGWAV